MVSDNTVEHPELLEGQAFSPKLRPYTRIRGQLRVHVVAQSVLNLLIISGQSWQEIIWRAAWTTQDPTAILFKCYNMCSLVLS